MIDAALLVAFNVGVERAGKIRYPNDGIERARFDQRGNGRPIPYPLVMPSEENILPHDYRFGGPFDVIVVDLDAPVGQTDAEAVRVFGGIGQSFAKRRSTATQHDAE